MMMLLSVFLAFCLTGFAASSQNDEIQFEAWSEPDISVRDTNCGCSKKPLPHCGCKVNIEINWREYVLEMTMTYIEEDNGIQYTVVFNHDKVLFNETFIAKPPSPICLGICPRSCFCVDYYNISFGEDDKWGGCTQIYAEVGVRLLDIKLGCFYFPVNQEEEKTIDKPIQLLLLKEMQQRFQGTFGKKMSDRRLKKKNPFDVLFKNRLEKDNK